MNSIAKIAEWTDICAVDDVPLRGARRVRLAGMEVGVFRNASGRVFAIDNQCPQKKHQKPIEDHTKQMQQST